MTTLAVVVTYNRYEMLKQCLQHLEKQTEKCDVLVVDNASTDETTAFLAQYQRDGFYRLQMNENTGGAGGFHAGLKWAVEHDYDLIWLMDDDTFPEKDALQKLLEAGAKMNYDFGWLSSMALWKNGSLCRMNCQRSTPYRDIGDFDKEIIPCQMASFVSLLIQSDTIRKYGFPIKEFFIWSDDWEYTRRISRTEKCYTVSSSKVIHAMKQNTVANIATDSPERLPRYRYLYRNDVYLYSREGIKGWIWVILKDCWHSFQVLTKRTELKKEALKTIWSGFREGLHFRPKIETGQS